MSKDPRSAILVRMPASIKKDLDALCDSQGVSLNAWVVEMIKYGLRHQRGLPQPPQAVAPLPTPADEIRAWAEGQKVLTPCGKRGECYGTTHPPETYDGMSFCKECQIRIA